MTLRGTAAMLLNFDVEPAMCAEHDRWHTQEHLPERLAIPGFRRATRWVATEGGPRCLVLYEVDDQAVLESPAYRARLDDPTPWTQRLMPHYRRMDRGFCAVLCSTGAGWGQATALLRFRLPAGAADAAALLAWLQGAVLPGLPTGPGLGSAHLLQGVAQPAMTREQGLRGRDGTVDMALLLSGWDAEAVAGQARQLAGQDSADGLPGRGADALSCALYRFDYALADADLPGR